jgi:hypothetical protein
MRLSNVRTMHSKESAKVETDKIQKRNTYFSFLSTCMSSRSSQFPMADVVTSVYYLSANIQYPRGSTKYLPPPPPPLSDNPCPTLPPYQSTVKP